MIHGLIFDVGGTITLSPDGIEFERACAEAACDWLELQDYAFDRSSFLESLLRHRRNLPKSTSGHRQINSTVDILRMVTLEAGVPLTGGQLRELEIAFNAPHVSGAEAMPGIAEVIRELSQTHHLAVISNTRSHQLIEAIVARFGIRDSFDPFSTSESFGVRKPDPGIFQAVSKAWAIPLEYIAMIGDSMENDVLAAQRLGMRGILLQTTSAGTVTNLADAVASASCELLQIVAAWNT